MVLSAFNEMLFDFQCPSCGRREQIVLSRLDNKDSWSCGHCQNRTDLRAEPYHSEIDKIRDTASEIDKQRRQRGEKVERVD